MSEVRTQGVVLCHPNDLQATHAWMDNEGNEQDVVTEGVCPNCDETTVEGKEGALAFLTEGFIVNCHQCGLIAHPKWQTEVNQ